MGLSPVFTLEDAAASRYATCNCRWHPGQRGDLVSALRSVEDGGSGRANEVYIWCEKELALNLQMQVVNGGALRFPVVINVFLGDR